MERATNTRPTEACCVHAKYENFVVCRNNHLFHCLVHLMKGKNDFPRIERRWRTHLAAQLDVVHRALSIVQVQADLVCRQLFREELS